ncbi:hypothetical protein [Nannocystis sp. SCPEA4]|uniref:hypothetical protein n=1 Tax=Nannocystis sp. SCPEA4 TaxID=2996787 RepID=UPI002270112F|nr:hypothetical protein [Nannocystis sp. SCPEA4]MCY1060887.1 hypothetical protein [Nannocystis sp. SCPEA4]
MLARRTVWWGVPALLWTLACDGSAAREGEAGKAPEAKAAEAKAPEAKAPEVKAPEMKAPEAKAAAAGAGLDDAALKAAQDEVAAEAAKAKAAATTPAAGLKFGKWKLASATWSDGGAAELTEAPARSIAACLRTVKKSRAEVVVTVTAGKIARAEVKGESLKCVEELRGVATPDVSHDGEFTALYTQ